MKEAPTYTPRYYSVNVAVGAEDGAAWIKWAEEKAAKQRQILSEQVYTLGIKKGTTHEQALESK